MVSTTSSSLVSLIVPPLLTSLSLYLATAFAEFSKVTLLVFKDTNPIRIFAVKVMTHWTFDNVILLAIFLNSVLLAITDYSTLCLEPDYEKSDPEYGLPDTRPESSFQNFLQEALDPVFTYIFIVECAVKLISMGFFSHKNSYLRDSWNCLDFLIVLTSIVGLMNIGSLNVSAIRTFRVLRPLKTLSALPGLQLIVRSLLSSIPALSSVIALITFVFTIFGILGTQIFIGITHHRCRVTPFPVTLDYNPAIHGTNYSHFRCLQDGEAVNFNVASSDGVDKESSPWYEAHDCYWPHSTTDEVRSCKLFFKKA